MQMILLLNQSRDRVMAVCIFTALAVILLAGGFAFSQASDAETYLEAFTKDWIVLSPPSKSFRIKLPEAPQQETRRPKQVPELDSDVDFSLFKCSKSINYYRLPSKTGMGNYRLVIREIDITGCKRTPSDFENDVSGFLRSMTDERRIIRDNQRTIYGLRGRAISYDNRPENQGTQERHIYNRVEIVAVDAGKRIIILVYFRAGGYDMDTIFETFRPRFEKNDLIVPDPPRKEPPIPINTESWIPFTAPDASFTVELPEIPKQKTEVAEPQNEKISLFRCWKSVDHVTLPPNEAGFSRLAILNVDLLGCDRKENDFENAIMTLLFFAGGDDMPIESDDSIKISGYRGRNLVYKTKSGLHHRVLAVDAGDRVFFVIYDRAQGNAAEEEQIFRTFFPRRRG